MKTEIVPFIPKHLARMNVKSDALKAASHPDMIPALERMGHTVLCEDGTVLAIIGAVPLIPGVCEVFVIASQEQEKYQIAFVKAVKKSLFPLLEKYRRIQSVSKNDAFHLRWLTWLGFRAEGVMRKYGLNGEDMVMWGMV